MRKGLLVGVLSLAALPAAAQDVPRSWTVAGDVAFIDVNVLPMDSERVLRAQTVVVSNGVISAIGPTASTPVRRVQPVWTPQVDTSCPG